MSILQYHFVGLNRLQSRIHKQYMNDLFVELCLTVPVRLRSVDVCTCVYVIDLINLHTYKWHPYAYALCMHTCMYVYLCMYICILYGK